MFGPPEGPPNPSRTSERASGPVPDLQEGLPNRSEALVGPPDLFWSFGKAS